MPDTNLNFPLKYHYHLAEETEEQKYQFTAQISEEETPKYIYHYSWEFDWVKLEDNVISECYLESGHRLKLTDRKLYINHRKSKKHWNLNSIISIDIKFKRLMLPLVIGGISAPLSFVALVSNFLHLWTGLAILFIGILLMVYGYKGSYQLSIQMSSDSFSIFLDEKTKPVISFINQVKKNIRKKVR